MNNDRGRVKYNEKTKSIELVESNEDPVIQKGIEKIVMRNGKLTTIKMYNNK